MLLLLLMSSAYALEPPVLRLSSLEEPTTIRWVDAATSQDRMIASFLMRGLLKYGPSSQLVCDLCSQVSISSDFKSYEFQLPEKLNWSDGVELQTKHFADALNLPARPWGKSIAKMEFSDRRYLSIQLHEPSELFAHWLTTPTAFPIRKEVKASDPPVTLGPYLMAAWEKGKRVVIEGNPEFKGERPVYRVEWIFGSESQNMERFKKGRVEVLSQPSTDQIQSLLVRKKIQVNPFLATRMLVFSQSSENAKNPHLRKTILYALRREHLPSLLKNAERTVTGVIPPGMAGNRALPLASLDLEKARSERTQVKKKDWISLTIQTSHSEVDHALVQWLNESLAPLKIKFTPVKSRHPSLEKITSDVALGVFAFQTASPLEIFASLDLGIAGTPTLKSVDQLTQSLEIEQVKVIPLGFPSQAFLLGDRVEVFSTTLFGDPDLVKIRLKKTN